MSWGLRACCRHYYSLQVAATVTPAVIWHLSRVLAAVTVCLWFILAYVFRIASEMSNVICLCCRTCSWSTGTIHQVCWEETSRSLFAYSPFLSFLPFFSSHLCVFFSPVLRFSPILSPSVAGRLRKHKIGRVLVPVGLIIYSLLQLQDAL